MLTSYKELNVYKEAYSLAVEIHKAIARLPRFETNDLAFQMRKASKSVPANIAEGWAKRRFPKEFKHHLDIALGSCNEMEVHIHLAMDLCYWEEKVCREFLARYVQLGGKIVRLRDTWKTY